MNLSNITRRLTGTVALLGLSLLATQSHAQLRTFAQFDSNGNTPVGAFVFTNSGSASTFNLVSSSTPFNLKYNTANSYGTAFVGIPAYVSLTANVAGPATQLGSTITQNLSNITITFTAVNPKGGLSNLLTANFGPSDGSLIFASGAQGGGQATLNVGHSNPAGVVNYTSDFLDFTNTPQHIYQSEQFALSFSGVNNTVISGNGPTINSNGYLDSFVADGNGTFSSNPVPPPKNNTVPEPATLTLMGMAMTAGLVGLRRRA